MKTWFITGTATGFGRALTEKLLADGNRVAATARNTEALKNLQEHYGDRVWVAKLDVTNSSQVKEVVKKAFDDLGQIDIIVNNAGYALFCAAEEANDDQIMQEIETNISALFRLSGLPFLICASREAAGSSRYHLPEAKQPIRTSAIII